MCEVFMSALFQASRIVDKTVHENHATQSMNLTSVSSNNGYTNVYERVCTRYYCITFLLSVKVWHVLKRKSCVGVRIWLKQNWKDSKSLFNLFFNPKRTSRQGFHFSTLEQYLNGFMQHKTCHDSGRNIVPCKAHEKVTMHWCTFNPSLTQR